MNVPEQPDTSSMKTPKNLTRRTVLKTLGAGGALAGVTRAAGTPAIEPRETSSARSARPGTPAPGSAGVRCILDERVQGTPLIDTHEHLIEEAERLRGIAHPRVPCDDWAVLFSHYLNSDLLTSGMPPGELERFLSPAPDPQEKWTILAPYWPAVKNTGYAQAVRLAIRELYDVDELSSATVARVQAGYDATRHTGFYGEILQQRAGIESCQVNCLTGEPFKESAQPTLLMQDISIVGMFAGPQLGEYAKPAGIHVRSLGDWHRVIRWWFERYAKYAVAVKSQNAYSRDIDYERVPAERAEPVFNKLLRKEPVRAAERKLVEDHLFWEAVDRATEHGLPVKLHTGYYAGQNSMPPDRLLRNAGSAAALCRRSPDTQFVFMHICYPHYEDILSVAKQYTNAVVDMCWSWIINPVAAKDFLKKFIVTAPANKVLPFGGDYIPVEPVLGHAIMARQGITQALAELVDEAWLSLDDALDLVEPILHGNARKLFRLEDKAAALAAAPWVTRPGIR